MHMYMAPCINYLSVRSRLDRCAPSLCAELVCLNRYIAKRCAPSDMRQAQKGK